ncbi:MAG: hypothetical protein U9Q98_01790 [Bacteroidota bacterium]|nr:hypothetical protein [Bacteroidota bacterium]
MKNHIYYIILFVTTNIVFTPAIFAQQTDNYLVLCSTQEPTSHYYEAGVTLSDYRNAEIQFFNPGQPENLLPLLSSIEPRYVALVMQPLEIDVNFVRAFLMISTHIDTDPFSDFSYGFTTGATGQDAVDFVNTIIQAETEHIEDFPLNVGGY